MKRKPKTKQPARVRIGTEDQKPSRDYWEAEAKLAIRSIAEIGDENRQLRATVANQAQLIKELRDDISREFAAGGRYAVAKAIEAADRWAQAAARILDDCAIVPDILRAAKAVRFFAEGAMPKGSATIKTKDEREADHRKAFELAFSNLSGKTAADR